MAPSTSTLSSASPDRLVMLDPEITAQDQQHQQQLQQHHLQQHEIEQDHQELAVLPKPVGRKRKKSEGNQNEMGESQPRRLRRLHEACARCRSKKIKCDAKHPSCSACEVANVECNQEDRHNQTLKPRGYTERLEAQLSKCVILLQKYVEGFRLENIDEIMAREGVHMPNFGDLAARNMQPYPGPPNYGPGPSRHNGMDHGPPPPHLMSPYPPPGGFPSPFRPGFRNEGQPPPFAPPNFRDGATGQPFRDGASPSYRDEPTGPAFRDGPTQPPFPRDSPQSFREAQSFRDGPPQSFRDGPPQSFRDGGPSNQPFRDGPANQFREGYNPGQPIPQRAGPGMIAFPPVPSQPTAEGVKGQDPHANDLTSTGGLIKAFGVSHDIVHDLHQAPPDREDMLLQSMEETHPGGFTQKSLLDQAWMSQPIVRSHHGVPNAEFRRFYLPQDRARADMIINCYFEELDWHRPVFIRQDFHESVQALYDSVEGNPINPRYSNIQDDPGFICSLYLALALGTLCIDNMKLHRLIVDEAPTWPTPDEFFTQALAIKPDLRVTISSLQALILLHWYLYTERHGRTLWRNVGGMVRLAIELGLHHDPTEQANTFTPEECQLRMRLWWIVMIHDRGTSVLLGRPLAIAAAEFNTPAPTKGHPHAFSEHFEFSVPLVRIQGDIIDALYRPGRQSGDQILRHATRIERTFAGFRASLPQAYQHLFAGTESWTMDERSQLVLQEVTADRGLTMLKYGIARILLLRALFNARELDQDTRSKALEDAVITSHNILIVHAQLTSFPNIAFFVSPIPIQIAAMVILYGSISSCTALKEREAREDVGIALKLIPLFRWRWVRKDAHGSYPLIVRLAQMVFGPEVMHSYGPYSPPILKEERPWTTKFSPQPGASPVTLSPTTPPFTTPMIQQQQQRQHQLQQQRNEMMQTEIPPPGIFFAAPNIQIDANNVAIKDVEPHSPNRAEINALLAQIGFQQAPGNHDIISAQHLYVQEEYDRDALINGPMPAGTMLNHFSGVHQG